MRKKWVFWGFFVFLAGIQFLPILEVEKNPPIEKVPTWDSETTKQFFSRACADCHSHETRWPWYSHVAPISWLIRYHVREGREHFNISRHGLQKKDKSHEAAEELEDGSMPLLPYLWLHPEARLTPAEKRQFVEGLRRTFPPREKSWIE
ncbi:MAG: heme-binding domain-containing protein [Leptospiraceae bacterium]|nr:heme-binding domain-containing protein [Leptospiraceae bacterium]MDW8307351.1 heme-binding domain-containing protein [Leptospiraceae bacterium]